MNSSMKDKVELMYRDERQRAVELLFSPLGPMKSIALRTPVYELLKELKEEEIASNRIVEQRHDYRAQQVSVDLLGLGCFFCSSK